MNIGIIDAEIIGKSKHRFPNLVCMKISSYYKAHDNNVTLCLSYDDIDKFDKVFISKVFIKTDIPMEDKSVQKTEQNCADYYSKNQFLKNPKIEYGGTGFFYEKAPKLPYEIEHCKPDYHLYDQWIADCIANGAKVKEFKYYTDYSIGFLTRGCFRQCQFCVNKVYNKCQAHSQLTEFIDESRPKLCFLDDNFFACPTWCDIIDEVKATGKSFQFKQGLDERLLTEEKIKEIQTWKYDGDLIFAFDNVDDEELIKSKLDMIYSVCPNWKKQMKFYCFCGFDRTGKYDDAFWRMDIADLFKRIFILAKYSALPYVMRHENYKLSPFEGIYNNVAAWCNQVSLFKSWTFENFCKCRGMNEAGYKKYKMDFAAYLQNGGGKGKAWRDYDTLIDALGDSELYHTQIKSCVEFGSWKGK